MALANSSVPSSAGRSMPPMPAGGARAGAAQPQQASGASVSGFRLQAKRVLPVAQLTAHFSELAFLELSTDKDTLVALNVENRDIQKNPYLFSIIYFRPGEIEVLYTTLPTMSPKKRKIDVLRHFLNLLTIAEDCYSVDMKQVYQLLESFITDMTEYVTADYDKLFSLYDNLKTEQAALQKKVKEMTDAAASLSKENYELKSRNDELSLKLKGLETFSDSVLALKIQEWLGEHKGEINISDFSKVYNIPEARVEQMLNKLVTEGYLETKG